MFELLFLGTSASVPTADRSLPAILVKHEGQRFLVDCGEGTQLRLMQAGESLKISHILLTHDHLDHILGLGGLLFSLSLRRLKPTPHIAIYGGSTTLERAQTLADMIRSKPGGDIGIALSYIEVSPGIVFENDKMTVTAFPTSHRERPCFGYTFQAKGKRGVKVVFTGDTGYMNSLVETARGADCLIAEANFASDQKELAQRAGHLTSVQAAEIAAQAEVKSLLLNHISRRYADNLEEVLEEAKAVFHNTIMPSDLDVFTITNEGAYLSHSPAVKSAEMTEELQRLRETSKSQEYLASLGAVSAALQHRLDNTLGLLTPIMMRLRRKIDPGDQESKELLNSMEKQIVHASGILSRLQVPLREEEKTPTDLNTIVYEVCTSLKEAESSLFQNVQTEFQLSELPLIEVDIGQIEEVFRNLVENAVKAMQPAGGVLTVTSRCQDGNVIEVEVSDTGKGIPVSIRERLFKEPIKSGMGLWLSKLILQRYGGEIKIKETVEGKGTTMLVRLPIAPQEL